MMFPCRLVDVPIRMPPDTVVPPPYVFAPDSVRVPVPALVNEPVPLMTPPYVPANAWSNLNAALFRMFPCRLVVVPVKMPADTVVPPPYVFAPDSVRFPVPYFDNVPVPLITPA